MITRNNTNSEKLSDGIFNRISDVQTNVDQIITRKASLENRVDSRSARSKSDFMVSYARLRKAIKVRATQII